MPINWTRAGIIAFWLVCFCASFVHYQLAEPTGDGFTRGFNRIVFFMIWQGAAFVLAVVAMLNAPRREDIGWTRIGSMVAHTPMIVSGIVFIAFVALISYLALFG